MVIVRGNRFRGRGEKKLEKLAEPCGGEVVFQAWIQIDGKGKVWKGACREQQVGNRAGAESRVHSRPETSIPRWTCLWGWHRAVWELEIGSFPKSLWWVALCAWTVGAGGVVYAEHLLSMWGYSILVCTRRVWPNPLGTESFFFFFWTLI